MVVYIEQTLLENFLVTYFVITIVNLFIKENKSLTRKIIASLFGSFLALLYPILNIEGMLLLLLKMCVGYIITLFAYGTKLIKKQMFFYCMFVFVTAIYGGISLMIHFSLYGNFTGEQKLPTILIVAVLMVVTYFLKQVASRLYQKKQLNNFIFKVIICNNGKQIKTNAYLDTGNVLCDKSGEPISLVNFKLFSLLNKNMNAINLLKKDLQSLKNGRLIKVKTLTGFDDVIVFNVDSIKIIDGKSAYNIQNPSFALSKVKISELGCDVVLNPKQLKGV